jgi:hypothetical protein
MRLFVLGKMPRVLIQETFEVFTAFLCIISGLPLVFGQVEANSINATLPIIAAQVWGLTLLVGAVLTLIGLLIANAVSGPGAFRRMISGHKIERLGLLALAWAGGLYGTTILFTNGLGGFVATMIIYIFALTCLVRAFVLSTGATMLHRALVSAAQDLETEI